MGLTQDKLASLSEYAHSDLFTHDEKLVLRLADRLTSTPASVSPEFFAELQRAFSDEQLVELGSAIGWENYRARSNRLFDVGSEDYSAGAFCPLPLPARRNEQNGDDADPDHE